MSATNSPVMSFSVQSEWPVTFARTASFGTLIS